MIIWGWRVRTSVADKGDFHCPHCSSRQPYRHEKLRRWFTLYFIPVIPLDRLGEHVTCGTCRKSWQMSVLANDPDKLKAQLLDRIARDWLRSMAAIAVSRGGSTPEMAQRIAADFEAIVGRRLLPSAITEAAAGLKPGGVPDAMVLSSLGNLPDDLSNTGRERFLVAVVGMLRKLTNCGPSEINLMRAIGARLGLSDAHVSGILLSAGLQPG